MLVLQRKDIGLNISGIILSFKIYNNYYNYKDTLIEISEQYDRSQEDETIAKSIKAAIPKKSWVEPVLECLLLLGTEVIVQAFSYFLYFL